MTHKKNFYERNKFLPERFIRGFLVKKKTPIVHGGRAQNVQLPKHLERQTKDWDVFVKQPKARAKELEKILDKKYGGDFWRVKKGATKRLKVHKVVSNVTGESFVDFSIADRKVPTISKRSLKFATLQDQVMRAKQNLKKPEAKFRRQKDLDFLRRVKKFEKLRGRKI